MKEEEQRIAIAEEKGWTECHKVEGLNLIKGIPPKRYKSLSNGLDGGFFEIPNYPFNLNAMHEVEKLLPKKKHELYFANLVPRLIDWMDPKEKAWPKVCFATAEQRAEAFLKTIGKWKESE